MNDSSLEQIAAMLAERVQNQSVMPSPKIESSTEQSAASNATVESAREQVNTLVRTVERVSGLVSAPLAAASPLAKRNDAEGAAGPGVVGTLSKFIVSPILGAVFSLFGSRSEEPPPVLPKFYLPEPVRTSAGMINSDGGQIHAVDQNFRGQIRTVGAEQGPPMRQVNVQIQAMDSRSFLDRSDDIARAVREAVLNSHALNDVITEL
jgi:hypothetical protein